MQVLHLPYYTGKRMETDDFFRKVYSNRERYDLPQTGLLEI
jgi:hypothetical protein